MRVSVSEVRPAPCCSIWFGCGHDDNGVVLKCAGDWRVMWEVADRIVGIGSTVLADVEGWQVLERGE